MGRLDEAEVELQAARAKIEAAIVEKQTDLDRLRLRQRSLRQTADMLKARAARHGVSVPAELEIASTRLAPDVDDADVEPRTR